MILRATVNVDNMKAGQWYSLPDNERTRSLLDAKLLSDRWPDGTPAPDVVPRVWRCCG